MEEEAKREEWAEMSGLCFIHLLGMQKDRNGADPHLALSRRIRSFCGARPASSCKEYNLEKRKSAAGQD
ncbi:hypothetical protein AV530_013135 [Patagioenas fasciata monilis]|uniref:Uncharacterized protein n=1 Tax=Patagioenas fasciata monilis TaxID=372326 RepID=A0A1V4JAR6_PATFA|nr:hypothetical protein AV530_013135 [Patagioenas fasciata monilis]